MATNPRYKNGHRRRQARAWVLATQDICGICGCAVDKDLPAGHPMAAEVDEIVPVSRGGSALDKSNLQIAHRICNQRKSNKMPGAPSTAADEALPTSQDW